ncbi:MAG: hypothetical protein AABZ47_10050 [Planctomycetota bacterium]
MAAPVIASAQTLPGYVATEFAQVPIPSYMSFASDGTLYVGNTLDGVATKIWRVTIAGAASPFGPNDPAEIWDPDAVLVDPTGAFTLTPGAVLVGGLGPGAIAGRIGFIDPVDESYTVLFDAPSVRNPGEMKFDSTGRLIYPGQNHPSIGQTNAIMQSSGATPQVLVDNIFAVALTIDSTDRILTVNVSTGALLRFLPNGTSDPLPVPVFLAPTTSSLERGVGSRFPAYLYAIDDGDFLAIDVNGNSQSIGSGFSPYLDFAFNPANGLLYLSDPNAQRIVRLDPDCDNNGIPDQSDIANCPPNDPSCGDCNANNIPDECDIAECPGAPACEDGNSNGVPDGCESQPIPAVSTWGLVVLVIGLTTAGTCVFRRHCVT